MNSRSIANESPYAKMWGVIRSHPIFAGIGDDAVREILPFFRFVTLQPQEVLFEEGLNSSMELFLVLDGNLEVIRNVAGDDSSREDTHQKFTIARLTPGDAIGELSFVRGDVRSASIMSDTRSTLLGLDPAEFAKLEDQYPAASVTMMKNMVGYVGDRLRQTSANEIKALRIELQNSVLNSQANLFFSYVIGLLCVYNLTIHLITNLSMEANRASLISAFIIVVFGAVLVLMIRQSKLPLHIFGLTLKNWKPALRESLVWTAVVIAGCVLLKWVLILNVDRYHHLPLFDFNLAQQKYLAFNFILYGLHSPIQEFVARGVLQGSLQHFFSGRNVTFRAIVVSNALFSATHVHLLGGLLGVIVFVPGLFWGWLYSRHESLIGVSVSHLLIGWTGLFFLNLESLF